MQVASCRNAAKRTARKRRGAALVEGIVTIMVFLTMILGMVDFGLLVLRHHVLSRAARQVARQAIVHGDLASELGSWGPGTINVAANNSGAIATLARSNLMLFDPANVNVQVQWPDGGNSVQLHHRVEVTLTAPTQPWLPLFGTTIFNMTASSTMPIAH